MPKLPITGEYPPDWPAINARTCEEAGHRCIRCGHPYRKGEQGSGEWTRCDERCTHGAPVEVIAMQGGGMHICARWRILTVHHFDGNKSNCSWWNLLALCQRCHLQIQGRVHPEKHYFLEHSVWAKPYVAGFYAKKYRGEDLNRAEVMARLEELLAIERLV